MLSIKQEELDAWKDVFKMLSLETATGILVLDTGLSMSIVSSMVHSAVFKRSSVSTFQCPIVRVQTLEAIGRRVW